MPDVLTIAFFGTGTMEVDVITDLMEEYIESKITTDEDPVRFIFPLTTDEFSDTMEQLVDMAKESHISYEVVTSTEDKGRRAFTEISNDATRTYHVADVPTQIEQILTESTLSVLEVLWDKARDGELSDIVGKFLDAGIDVRDLTEGNIRISADNGDEAEVVDAVTHEVETTAEAEQLELPIYARSELEKMSRAQVKEIALALNLPPRKASAAMIDEIMEAQGEPEVAEEPGEPVVVAEEAVTEPEEPAAAFVAATAFVAALDEWGDRLSGLFDEFLSRLDKIEIRVATPAAPAPPEPVQESPRRRLTRSR